MTTIKTNTRKYTNLLLAGLSWFLLAQSSYAIETVQKPLLKPAQENVPVRIGAEHISPYYGHDIDSLGVYSLKDGKIVGMPFQWTQLTNEGTVYSTAYKKIEIDGDLKVVDSFDRLEFMYSDAGQDQCIDTLESQMGTTTTTEKPLQIQVSPKGQKDQLRYICVVPAVAMPDLAKAKADYVTYDKDLGQASTDAYYLTLDKDNPLIWNDFHYQGVNLEKSSGLPIGDSILDSLKINIEAGVFTKMAKIHLDNTNLSTKVLDVQHGPIYDSMFGLTKVKLAGATVFKMQVMVHFYPHHVEMKTRFKIPKVAKAIVKAPQVDVSLDANNMWGSKIKTSWGPDAPMLVNGELDEREKAFTLQEVDSKDSWIWYSTQRGFDLFTFIDFDEEFQVPIALVYDDDKTKEIKPERFVGQGPNVGYSIRGMVMGKYFTFNTNLLFSEEVNSQDVESKVTALRKPWSFAATEAPTPGKSLQASLQ